MKGLKRRWLAAIAILCPFILPSSVAFAAPNRAAHPHLPHLRTCQFYTETDNIQVNGTGNPYYDDLGNQWIVYYDIQHDDSSNTICGIRLDVRIFNPSPDGAWNGTVALLAYVNGQYDSYSYGQVSSSGTYQNHFVWRGPWFGINSGSSLYIESRICNGSNQYTQAYANVSV